MTQPASPLPLYATPEEREALQQKLAGPHSPHDRLAWAWLMREDEPGMAQGWLADNPVVEADLRDRHRVLQAEMEAMRAGNHAGRRLAETLLAEIQAEGGDLLAQVDLHFLLYRLADQRADAEAVRRHLDAASSLCTDPRRSTLLRFERVRDWTFADPQSAWAEGRGSLPTTAEGLSLECACALAGCWAVLHAMRAEFTEGIAWMRCDLDWSVQTGQRRRAITAASNLAYMHTQSGQHEAALQALSEGLRLSRGGHWPGLEGGVHVNLAQIQRELGLLDAARENLEEAFVLFDRVPPGRSLGVAWGALGRLELDAGRPAQALEAFAQMAAQPSVGTSDLALIAALGQARALLALRRAPEALPWVTHAQELARQQHSQAYAVEALGLRADLLADLADATAPEAYRLALRSADALPDYQVDPQLLESAARCHASHGLLQPAYELALRASLLRQTRFTEATRRTLAGLRAEQAVARAESEAKLSAMQLQLVQKERQASLGAMVAGVAHEINTPVGNSLLVASALATELRPLLASLELGTPMRRSQLQALLTQQLQGLEVIESGMKNAARLVSSFKQVAVERSSEARCRFELAQLCEQCLASLGPSLRTGGVTARLELAEDWELDSYPGALGQVLLNLLGNALAHAFDGQPDPLIVVSGMRARGESIELQVRDNGRGMGEVVRRRIFEPFFTTRFGQGGSGLGLSISLNLVERVLGGRLTVQSQLGKGSCFTLELPLQAPHHTQY